MSSASLKLSEQVTNLIFRTARYSEITTHALEYAPCSDIHQVLFNWSCTISPFFCLTLTHHTIFVDLFSFLHGCEYDATRRRWPSIDKLLKLVDLSFSWPISEGRRREYHTWKAYQLILEIFVFLLYFLVDTASSPCISSRAW
jgi:hypothetical protein